MNQAVTDIVNCSLFGVPNIIWLIVSTVNHHDFNLQHEFYISSAALAISSSGAIFLIIAVERYLSLCKPLLHRGYVYKRLVWKCVFAGWLLALLMTAILTHAVVYGKNNNYYETTKFVFKCIIGVFICTIALLYFVTFVNTFRLNYKPGEVLPTRAKKSDHKSIRLKRQLRLTTTLFIMFIASTLSFIPALTSARYYLNATKQALYLLIYATSMLNPILTLYCCKRFRLTWRRTLGAKV